MADYSLFPEILPDSDFVDDSYHEAELERLDWAELRSVAAAHPCEEVNGRSEAEEIIATLTGKQRV